ncbi:MAG TPA: efflux transporter outer membrane subunit [Bryobacteraceae bacterium]|nr:efflux transporter outer membrane subunit [Bryobacteraceae bacterium]
MKLTSSLVAALLCIALAACMVGPKYNPPAAAPTPPNYKELNSAPNQPAPLPEPNADPTLGGLGDWKPADPQDALPHGKWWEMYNDPELNALEEQLNIDNQNIKQFFENFMAARAIVREARSQLFPTVTVGANYTRSRGSANLGSNVGATGTTSGKGSTGIIDFPLDASWTPDLFGRVRNTIRQAQFNAQVSAADLENERLTEQSSLAIFFFEIRGQDALRQILDATVAQDQKALELTRSQYDLGLTDRITVVQAEATLQSAQAAATNLGVARAQYEHAIALLVGKSASEFSIPVKPMLASPPPIPVGLPSQLLERRPDIAAAERTMAAANAQIGIATAAFYPNVTISAAAGFESSMWSKIFSWPSRFWSVGPSLSQTIFDAGLRRATVNQYTAVYNADVAAYRQSVLTAFQQVEDALASVRILTQQIQQQHQAVESARVALDLEMKRYETGIDPYINVVTEQNQLLSAQQVLAGIEIQRMSQSVSLIQALGGGWNRSDLATPQPVTAKQ